MNKSSDRARNVLLVICGLSLVFLFGCGLIAFMMPYRLESTYPGFFADAEYNGMGWRQYGLIHVTEPQEAVGLHIKLGDQPPVCLKELTPEMVKRFCDGEHIFDDGRHDGPKSPCLNMEIGFKNGQVVSANFQKGIWKNVRLFEDKKEITLPISGQEFDALFGEPLSSRSSLF